jgi:Flp pilus assembly protein TadG
LALAIPILMLLLMGVIEIGFMVKTKLVLQDAVRTALRYGSEAGTTTGTDGCFADETILDAIAGRITGSIVDPTHVRAIFIYATPQNSSAPEEAPTATALTSEPTPLHAGSAYLYGDYYNAKYDPSTGANLASSQIAQVFAGNTTSIVPSGSSATNPTCGATLLANSPTTYSSNIDTYLIPQGDWPPAWRNNQVDPVDRFGVTIVYDYAVQTPLFRALSTVVGHFGFLRMTEQASYWMSPD